MRSKPQLKKETDGELVASGMQEELQSRSEDVAHVMSTCPRCGQPLTGSHCDTCSG